MVIIDSPYNTIEFNGHTYVFQRAYSSNSMHIRKEGTEDLYEEAIDRISIDGAPIEPPTYIETIFPIEVTE